MSNPISNAVMKAIAESVHGEPQSPPPFSASDHPATRGYVAIEFDGLTDDEWVLVGSKTKPSGTLWIKPCLFDRIGPVLDMRTELARLTAALAAANERAEKAELERDLARVECVAWRKAWFGRDDDTGMSDPGHSHEMYGFWDDGGPCHSCGRFADVAKAMKDNPLPERTHG